MCTYNTCKKTKAKDPLTVVMLETFIVDEGDIPVEDGPEHPLVIRLFLFCVGEEKIGLILYQRIHRHFLDPEKHVTARYIVRDLNTGGPVFPIGITAVGRRLYQDPDIRGILLDPFTLSRGQRHSVVGRNFPFPK